MKPNNASEHALLIETAQDSRRRFLRQAGTATFSGIAVALLGGCTITRAAGTSTASDADDAVAKDVRILNTAVAAEYEAIAAYQVGAESGLLKPQVLKVALNFQSQHKQHAEALASAVRKLGGEAADPKTHYNFPVDKLKSQEDVLQFAAGLERGAVSAYVGAIPLFDHRELSGAAASILADEAMHWAVLRHALGLDPVPQAFYS
ncbi:MAG: ferritin-like domain-containing protein [Nitrococcus sp.]|nr:ferritin-like domain-containing protein [Nitrococcus sp.]